MKKIVLYLSDMEKGGAQRVIANLANYLVKYYDVTILTTYGSELHYDIDSRIKHINLNYNYRVYNSKISRLRDMYKFLGKLKNTINNIAPDTVITFLTFEIHSILAIKAFLKTKVIISFRNSPSTIYKSTFQKLRINNMMRLSDGVIFQTDEAKNFFTEKVHHKSIIINNPINNDFIVKPYCGERKKEIVAVGKLYPQKNHKLLIDAFSKISSNLPEYKLVIYGEGALRAELEEQVRKLHLEDRVYLPGIRDNIQNYIYNASLFVLSSDFEGVSNALLEALALGLPVISTDCSGGGSREVINHGVNGLLVPVNNVNELSESMERVLKDENLSRYLSENASLIQEKLNPDKINKQWEDYLLNIMRG